MSTPVTFPRAFPLILLAGALAAVSAGSGHVPSGPTSQQALSRAAELPYAFEANRGQTDPTVRFVARGGGYTAFWTDSELVLALRSAPGRRRDPGWSRPQPLRRAAERRVIRLSFPGGRASRLTATPDSLLPGVSHYVRRAPAPASPISAERYRRIVARETYPGVDVAYYSRERQLEYDFIVHPGGRPQSIRVAVDGARPELTPAGDAVLRSGDETLMMKAPVAYQTDDRDARTVVRAAYRLTDAGELTFDLGSYDTRRDLVIDPILLYTGAFGGSGFDSGLGAALDATGAAYIVGTTETLDFPTAGAAQAALRGFSDVFITKISPDGSTLGYSTYLGGSGDEVATDVEVGADGRAFIVGTTDSKDFPTVTPILNANGGGDAFVCCVAPNGASLLYSTYLGGTGSDGATGLAVNGDGAAFVSGYTESTDFPTTVGAFQRVFGGDFDAFVARIAPGGAALTYSTFLGGSDGDNANAIALGADGTATVAGHTDSGDFPVVIGSPIPLFRGGRFGDGFVSRLAADGGSLNFSTFVGGSASDAATGVAVDLAGNMYVGGTTDSEDVLIASPTIIPFQPAHAAGSTDGFLVAFNAAGTAIRYDTYLGGAARDTIRSIAVDNDPAPETKVYVLGETESADFPKSDPIQASIAGDSDLFLTKLHPATTLATPRVVLDYSTFIGAALAEHAGALAVDTVGNLVFTGDSESPLFPEHRLLPGRKRSTAAARRRGIDVVVTRVFDGEFRPGGAINVKSTLQVGAATATKSRLVNLPIANRSRTGNLAIRVQPPQAPFGVSPGAMLSLLLAPNSTYNLPVTLAAGTTGVIPPGVIVIDSSDPTRPRVVVSLKGKGGRAPAAAASAE